MLDTISFLQFESHRHNDDLKKKGGAYVKVGFSSLQILHVSSLSWYDFLQILQVSSCNGTPHRLPKRWQSRTGWKLPT